MLISAFLTDLQPQWLLSEPGSWGWPLSDDKIVQITGAALDAGLEDSRVVTIPKLGEDGGVLLLGPSPADCRVGLLGQMIQIGLKKLTPVIQPETARKTPKRQPPEAKRPSQN